MSAQLQLTQEELDLIEANRQAQAAAEAAAEAERVKLHAERAAREAERKAAALVSLKKELAARYEMAMALKAADKNNVCSYAESIDEDTGMTVVTVTFTIGDREERICISEKRDRNWGIRNTGVYQYSLSGSFNSYKTRHYKNVNTLLARIVEFQEINTAQRANQVKKNNLESATVDLLTKTYPNADIAKKSPCKWSSDCSDYSTTYHVTTTKGLVVFTSFMKDGVVELKTYKVVLTKEMMAAAKAEILAAAAT